MKKLLVAVCLLVSMFGIAQEDKKLSAEDQEKMQKGMAMLFDSKIAMDIDAKVFPTNEGNTYFNEAQTAGIIGMLVPQTYEKLKAKMGEDVKKPGVTIIDKGETTLGGEKVLFQKAKREKDGQEVFVYVYCKKNDAESCLMITSFFEKEKENEMKPHIEKAVASAKLVK